MDKRIMAHVTMMKLIPEASPYYRQLWEIPENHKSIGLICSDIEDVMYMAADDATKKARIKVLYLETVYCGEQYAWSRYGGEIICVISGERVEDVRDGLRYIKDYIENRSGSYVCTPEEDTGYYVDLVPRAGKYFRETYDIPENTAIAYLVSTPIESTYGLDKALKAGDTKIAELFDAPTRVNTGGAILYGTESACRAAVDAFVGGVKHCIFHPMDPE